MVKEDDRLFDAGALETKTEQIAETTTAPMDYTKLQHIFSDCGIRFYTLSPFQKLKGCGIVRRNKNNSYVMIMSNENSGNEDFARDFINS